jgi:hypothetical protein
VEHAVDALHGLLHVRRVPEITDDELHVGKRAQVLAVARGEVVQHADAIAALHEALDDVRADEPRAARHHVQFSTHAGDST